MVDNLNGIGPGTVVAGATDSFKVFKVDVKPRRVKLFKVNRGKGMNASFMEERLVLEEARPRLPAIEVIRVSVKALPIHWEGTPSSKDFRFLDVVLLVGGSPDLFESFVGAERFYKPERYGVVDASAVTFSQAEEAPRPMVDTKRFKKVDLICAVLLAHGPLVKDDILRRVAALEGKPWIRTSNGDYFSIPRQRQGAYEECGAIGRKATWYCTPVGVSRGSQVLGEIGVDAVKALT